MNTAMDPIARMLGSWAGEITFGSILLRMALSFLFATALGWERSRKLHSAGLRTFILTGLAATAAMLVDLYSWSLGLSKIPLVSVSAVVGIALIGGNSFFYSSKNQVKGLTTAVALLGSGVLSVAVGIGFYTAAGISFAAFFLCLAVLPRMESYLKDHSNHFELHLELKTRESLPDFITTIRRLGLRVDDIEANPAYVGSGLSVFSVSVTVAGEKLKQYKKHSEMIAALQTLDYVSFLEEIQ